MQVRIPTSFVPRHLSPCPLVLSFPAARSLVPCFGGPRPPYSLVPRLYKFFYLYI
jgi:hypothetical protein